MAVFCEYEQESHRAAEPDENSSRTLFMAVCGGPKLASPSSKMGSPGYKSLLFVRVLAFWVTIGFFEETCYLFPSKA